MKNIFKFMGIALMACSLMVACGNKDEENNDTTPQEEQIPNGVNVTFNGESWTASSVSCAYFESYGAIEFYGAQTADEYPIFDEVIYSAEVGTTTESTTTGQFSNQVHMYVEYYYDSYLYDNDGNNYGDWWAAEATTEIKAVDLTALTATAKMSGTFFDAGQAFAGETAVGFAAADRAPYTATFGNVSLGSK